MLQVIAIGRSRLPDYSLPLAVAFLIAALLAASDGRPHTPRPQSVPYPTRRAVAPLAFVAYLLPNTESLFTRWRKMLTYCAVGISDHCTGVRREQTCVQRLFHHHRSRRIWLRQSDGARHCTVIPLFVSLPRYSRAAVAAVPVIGGKLQGMSNKATGRASSAGQEGDAKPIARQTRHLSRQREQISCRQKHRER
jgi:hypothetical protein